MEPKVSNILVCPSCGAENIEGADTCANCLSDLRSVDVPETAQAESASDLLDVLAGLRLGKPGTVTRTMSVRDAVATLQKDPSGGVVVVDRGKVVGVFTERDVLLKVAGNPGAMDRPVADLMTPDPVVLHDSDTVAMALNKMAEGGFRHVPVLREGELIGVVNNRHVLSWLMSRYFD